MSRLGLRFEPGERDNAVGTWNPAWGPRPEPKPAPTPPLPRPPKSRLQRASCPGCTADDALFWGPPGTYSCTSCGTEMVVTVVRKPRSPQKLSIHVGERYGRLVIQAIERAPGRELRAVCVCDCGAIKTIRAKHLRAGRTRSCGCLYREHNLSHPWRRSYKGGGVSDVPTP